MEPHFKSKKSSPLGEPIQYGIPKSEIGKNICRIDFSNVTFVANKLHSIRAKSSAPRM
jgi:hypothetical protein